LTPETTTDLAVLEELVQLSGRDVVDVGCGSGGLVRERRRELLFGDLDADHPRAASRQVADADARRPSASCDSAADLSAAFTA